MRRDADLGSITAGKLADLLLVEGDPCKDISDIRRTALVMKDGMIFDPAQIEAALGLSPRENPERETALSRPADLR